MKKLPLILKKYFWDVSFEKIDLKKSRAYIVKRLLEYGDGKAIKWMWHNFEKTEVKDVLSNSRGFSVKSANFWALILNISKEEVLCLRKRSSKAPKIIWPY
ncbi:MAG: hypothetical protein ABII25_06650 [bacterium]